MSHRVHPYAHRLGIIRGWKSRWFGMGKKYREHLMSDTMVRKFITKKLTGMYVSLVEIERGQKNIRIIIKTSRPGLVIGRNGEGSEKLRNDIVKFMNKNKLNPENIEIKLDIEEIHSPESDAQIVAQQVKEALEKRMPFRRVLKQTVEKVMANRDVKGVRVKMGGRLNGADMARNEELRKGRVPLQTFRADIDFARTRATIPQGDIGVKVWIYRGEIFENDK
ncbi:MAG TPA: 30S ribosomal protein S3 [Candidatus Paceibacterota bacterium]|nr:30S ribosomal protein S3 [Candidatus Paceibacterota bacterium]HMP19193.1 30S ribosomal protein S3 [Candidatus Paceibacterota bacterium]HMP85276.1 30S ribosomal protein S3 [Candidatus Paceibacterota bacterium]